MKATGACGCNFDLFFLCAVSISLCCIQREKLCSLDPNLMLSNHSSSTEARSDHLRDRLHQFKRVLKKISSVSCTGG